MKDRDAKPKGDGGPGQRKDTPTPHCGCFPPPHSPTLHSPLHSPADSPLPLLRRRPTEAAAGSPTQSLARVRVLRICRLPQGFSAGPPLHSLAPLQPIIHLPECGGAGGRWVLAFIPCSRAAGFVSLLGLKELKTRNLGVYCDVGCCRDQVKGTSVVYW